MNTLARVFVLFLFGVPAAAQQTAPSASLSPTERAGEKLFLQRCSLCHLGSAPTYKPYGPRLDGVVAVKGDERIRNAILEGSPGMPAWRYSLQPEQVDTIVSYMKTLRKP